MSALANKAQDDTGNNFMFVTNMKLWEDINTVLGDYLANYKTDGTYLYSKGANDYVKVGATYNSFVWAGNTITFAVDRSLSREYPTKGYGVCIDLTADKTSGTPAIAKFALHNLDFITNKILGVGGFDGKTSGEVSSNVAASKMVMST